MDTATHLPESLEMSSAVFIIGIVKHVSALDSVVPPSGSEIVASEPQSSLGGNPFLISQESRPATGIRKSLAFIATTLVAVSVHRHSNQQKPSYRSCEKACIAGMWLKQT
ncbi:hypothetical protein BaRGS_00003428 [Batillaria attramentaria]|uniref:Uncharacterized protein n=1 Tax=Batillaria attramentaria TaxID=370345 RepID=A0ABD0M1A4_9CAEN